MLVDSHVHLYSCYELDGLLDSALDNLRRAARPGEGSDRVAGCLALTETARDHAYAAILAGEPKWRPQRWTIRATGEAAAIVCSSPGNDEIIVLSGSQIVTAENLEVLALATTKRYPDGRSIEQTLDALAADAVPAVIPWGFGKWWFRRGRLLSDLVRRSDPTAFFLGDNGGRPALTPRPPLFVDAERRGFRVLPGTDQFPYASQQRKTGTFGFMLESWHFDDRPAAQFRARLARLDRSPPTFGSRVNLLEFAWLQVAMNLRNRMPRMA
jgi:hypothetical protein